MPREEKLYYPFKYFHHRAFTVALYGLNDPLIIKGRLTLRTYYKDAAMTIVDYKRTSDHYMDEIFYQSNKVIREQNDESYSGKRELIELSVPELGSEYRIIYNGAETPSGRSDDAIHYLSLRDPSAKGVAIILRRDPNKGIQYLTEAEARKVAEILKER